MVKKHWVPRHKWSNSKSGYHPGYWRKTRKKSGKTKIDKKIVKMHPIRDTKTGYILGYKV